MPPATGRAVVPSHYRPAPVRPGTIPEDTPDPHRPAGSRSRPPSCLDDEPVLPETVRALVDAAPLTGSARNRSAVALRRGHRRLAALRPEPALVFTPSIVATAVRDRPAGRGRRLCAGTPQPDRRPGRAVARARSHCGRARLLPGDALPGREQVLSIPFVVVCLTQQYVTETVKYN
ncbi:hypothetical protein HBB16_14400, partial [Pseudonocardia sp. MCCB 268]|nr:hypothetical protein [Pseudonocardia cytotoxica]